ncbi:hypothetical protein [Rhodanobacter sp. MP7CTX1]|uniref:hypothetical protein n=1 Tax=Rhodanobacter sp. MP7CTX1 TaxID=2723084 RepID=UPI00160F62D4|nr:hypothetical protein [Rhodanobacter sp. MP7CTX1]MBB6187558.1 hypothetical protein [Rhodanobacter sp. MP7CTX1]
MNTQPIILFLELECVVYSDLGLRRIDAHERESAPSFGKSAVFSNAEVFAEIIAPYSDRMEIVITDWAAVHSPLADFCRRLPESVAARVVDSLYLEELTDSSWSDYHSALATRYACIQLWLARRRPNRRHDWLALDMGRQLDDWPNEEMRHLVCGSLSYPNIRQQLADSLREQCRA